MVGFKGVRGWIVVAAVCGLAAGASAVKAFQPTGPAVGTGAMPLKTVYLAQSSAQGALFEVPQGQTLVVTDLMILFPKVCPLSEGPVGPSVALAVDGAQMLTAEIVVHNGVVVVDNSSVHLNTGIAAGPGTKVGVVNTSPKCKDVGAVATGYLMRN